MRPLTNRLTTADNAQPRGQAPTTKLPSHPTGDNVQTVDTHDQKGTKLAQLTSETFPELSNLPGSGTNDGDRYQAQLRTTAWNTTQLKLWRHEQLQK